MTYETAIKLRDARFPFKMKPYSAIKPDNTILMEDDPETKTGEWVEFPSDEELAEAWLDLNKKP